MQEKNIKYHVPENLKSTLSIDVMINNSSTSHGMACLKNFIFILNCYRELISNK